MVLDTVLKSLLGTQAERDLRRLRRLADSVNEAGEELLVEMGEYVDRTARNEQVQLDANQRFLDIAFPVPNGIYRVGERKQADREDITRSFLAGKKFEFKRRVDEGESLESLLPEAFAVVREAGTKALGMRHFDVQLMGGAALHQGTIAEMVTGEGKTLTATLPAYLNALAGKVHIATANDYLARRDAEDMGALYRALGLSVGFLQADMKNKERKAAYRCDIVYGTASQFAFDYLRDNTRTEQVQPELSEVFAIVDEAPKEGYQGVYKGAKNIF